MEDIDNMIKGLLDLRRPRRRRRKRRTRPYTKGELNKLIDDLIHPYARENPAYYVLDGVLHGIVERNPNESIRKFIKNNLPKMLEHMDDS